MVRKAQGKGLQQRTKQVSKRAPQPKRPKRRAAVQKRKPATDSDTNVESSSTSTSSSTGSSNRTSSHDVISSG